MQSLPPPPPMIFHHGEPGMSTHLPASLATPMDVVTFLKDTPFACKLENVVQFDGDIISIKFRIRLDSPFRNNCTVIVKHAPIIIPGSDQCLPFDPTREMAYNIFEAYALCNLNFSIPSSAIVTVPQIYAIYADDNLFIMEDFGSDFLTLGALLCSRNLISSDVVTEIGKYLGSFFAWLHVWSRKNGEKIIRFFNGNVAKRTLFEGSVNFLESALLNPYDDMLSELSGFRLNPDLAGLALDTAFSVRAGALTTCDVLVMGQLFPENILVYRNALEPDRLQRLVLVNWEFVTTGIPGFDVGTFCANLHFFMLFDSFVEKAVRMLTAQFLRSYAQGIHHHFSRHTIARYALAYWGIRLAWLSPGLNQIDKPKALNIAELGVLYLLGSGDADFVDFIMPDLLAN